MNYAQQMNESMDRLNRTTNYRGWPCVPTRPLYFSSVLLRSFMDDHKIGPKKLNLKCGFPKETVDKFLNGSQKPTRERLERVARELGLEPMDLMVEVDFE